MKNFIWPSLVVAFFALGVYLGKRNIKETVNNESAKISQIDIKETKEKIVAPDGTITEKIVTETKTIENEKIKVVSQKEPKLDKNKVGVLVKSSYSQLLPPIYGLSYERRLADLPLWLGLQVYQDRSVALSLALSF